MVRRGQNRPVMRTIFRVFPGDGLGDGTGASNSVEASMVESCEWLTSALVDRANNGANVHETWVDAADGALVAHRDDVVACFVAVLADAGAEVEEAHAVELLGTWLWEKKQSKKKSDRGLPPNFVVTVNDGSLDWVNVRRYTHTLFDEIRRNIDVTGYNAVSSIFRGLGKALTAAVGNDAPTAAKADALQAELGLGGWDAEGEAPTADLVAALDATGKFNAIGWWGNSVSMVFRMLHVALGVKVGTPLPTRMTVADLVDAVLRKCAKKQAQDTKFGRQRKARQQRGESRKKSATKKAAAAAAGPKRKRGRPRKVRSETTDDGDAPTRANRSRDRGVKRARSQVEAEEAKIALDDLFCRDTLEDGFEAGLADESSPAFAAGAERSPKRSKRSPTPVATDDSAPPHVRGSVAAAAASVASAVMASDAWYTSDTSRPRWEPTGSRAAPTQPYTATKKQQQQKKASSGSGKASANKGPSLVVVKAEPGLLLTMDEIDRGIAAAAAGSGADDTAFGRSALGGGGMADLSDEEVMDWGAIPTLAPLAGPAMSCAAAARSPFSPFPVATTLYTPSPVGTPSQGLDLGGGGGGGGGMGGLGNDGHAAPWELPFFGGSPSGFGTVYSNTDAVTGTDMAPLQADFGSLHRLDTGSAVPTPMDARSTTTAMAGDLLNPNGSMEAMLSGLVGAGFGDIFADSTTATPGAGSDGAATGW